MSSYTDIFPPVETVLEMEPEELAPFLLRYLDKTGAQQLNRHNFLLGNSPNFRDWVGDDYQRKEAVMERLSPAWMWLERELFIAPKGSTNLMFITHRGREVLESEDFEAYKKASLLPSDNLDPILVRKATPAFIRGDYELAVIGAFKEVEVRVRKVAKLTNKDIGVKLMRRAFGDTGTLTDKEADKGEQDATRELFVGAIGTFKNPSSHRDVDFSDPNEASDMIHFANQLLRIVERRKEKEE